MSLVETGALKSNKVSLIETSYLMKFVLDNPDNPWDWIVLSYNPNITIKDVKDNPDKPWNYYYLSCNKFKYDKSLQKIQFNKLKSINKNKMKYKKVFSHRSQDFWKWYCGDGGIGRSVDVMRSGCK